MLMHGDPLTGNILGFCLLFSPVILTILLVVVGLIDSRNGVSKETMDILRGKK